jgi:hypothetical protein
MRQSPRQRRGRTSSWPNYTQALYDARELAMERMQAEALEAKAEGIVGVDLHERSHGWGSHVIEFFAIGTAIIPMCRGRRGGPAGSSRTRSWLKYMNSIDFMRFRGQGLTTAATPIN